MVLLWRERADRPSGAAGDSSTDGKRQLLSLAPTVQLLNNHRGCRQTVTKIAVSALQPFPGSSTSATQRSLLFSSGQSVGDKCFYQDKAAGCRRSLCQDWISSAWLRLASGGRTWGVLEKKAGSSTGSRCVWWLDSQISFFKSWEHLSGAPSKLREAACFADNTRWLRCIALVLVSQSLCVSTAGLCQVWANEHGRWASDRGVSVPWQSRDPSDPCSFIWRVLMRQN